MKDYHYNISMHRLVIVFVHLIEKKSIFTKRAL